MGPTSKYPSTFLKQRFTTTQAYRLSPRPSSFDELYGMTPFRLFSWKAAMRLATKATFSSSQGCAQSTTPCMRTKSKRQT